MMTGDKKSPHILSTSSNLVGLCFVVLTSIKVLKINETTLIDEVATIAIVLFMGSIIVSFLSIRSENNLHPRLLMLADIFFMSALFLLFITAMMISFNVID